MASTLSFTIFLYYLFLFPLLLGLSSSKYTGVYSSHLLFYVISCREKGKWIKTGGDYSLGFKVPIHREEIVDPLEKYGVNHDISPN